MLSRDWRSLRPAAKSFDARTAPDSVCRKSQSSERMTCAFS